MDAELVQMFVAPANGYLQRVVQIRNRAVTSHQQAPPDRWDDLQNPHRKLVDFIRGLGRCHSSSQFSEPPSRSKGVQKTSGQSFSPRFTPLSRSTAQTKKVHVV